MPRTMPIEEFINDIRRQLKDVGKYGDRIIITYKGKPSSILINYEQYDDFDDYIKAEEEEEYFMAMLRDTEMMIDSNKDIMNKIKTTAKEENDGNEEIQATINKVILGIAEERLQKWLESEARNEKDCLEKHPLTPERSLKEVDEAWEAREKEKVKEALKEELYVMFMKMVEAEKEVGGHNLH
ncbi:MAG: hypothetical protein ACE5D4_08965 [Thermodesulfobacteriota bacterium]